MQVEGTIIKIGNTETVSEKFKKRLLVLETDEQYPQQLPVEFVQDKTDLLDSFKETEKVVVGINLRGREYKGKYYSNIQGWRIEYASKAAAAEPVAAEADDDLPF